MRLGNFNQGVDDNHGVDVIASQLMKVREEKEATRSGLRRLDPAGFELDAYFIGEGGMTCEGAGDMREQGG